MNKKITGILGIAALSLATAWNVYQSQIADDFSTLLLDNIEALASGEGGSEYHSSYHYDSVLNKNICNGPGSSC